MVVIRCSTATGIDTDARSLYTNILNHESVTQLCVSPNNPKIMYEFVADELCAMTTGPDFFNVLLNVHFRSARRLAA